MPISLVSSTRLVRAPVRSLDSGAGPLTRGSLARSAGERARRTRPASGPQAPDAPPGYHDSDLMRHRRVRLDQGWPRRNACRSAGSRRSRIAAQSDRAQIARTTTGSGGDRTLSGTLKARGTRPETTRSGRRSRRRPPGSARPGLAGWRHPLTWSRATFKLTLRVHQDPRDRPGAIPHPKRGQNNPWPPPVLRAAMVGDDPGTVTPNNSTRPALAPGRSD
jgi:hypothetical protein